VFIDFKYNDYANSFIRNALCFFVLSGFLLCLYPKFRTLFVAGIAFVLGNWIRPLALFFLLAALLYMILKKYKWYYFASLFVAIFVSVFIIGKTTENKIGYFVYQSITLGYNLMMTAHDEATGTLDFLIFEDSTKIGYLENKEQLTFVEKDRIWRKHVVDWIKHNPVKFTALFVKKNSCTFYSRFVDMGFADRILL
jgi:hypothetical protein